MEQAVKQRLVGVAVLTALAVITLPMIFDTERPQSVQVPETAPPAPDMPSVAIPEPQPVEPPSDRPPGEPVPVGEMYRMAGDQPADTSDVALSQGVTDDAVRAFMPARPATASVPPPSQPSQPVADTAPPETPAPPPAEPVAAKTDVPPPLPPLPAAPVSKLDKNGVPEGWVVQVAAMSDRKKAEALVVKLKLGGHAAFTQASQDARGETIRVFVGPKLDKAQAVRTKQQIDSEFGLQTMVKQFSPR